MSTTLQIRIDEGLKKKAQKVAEDMGMDLSSVVKTTLAQMVRIGGLPFTPRTANGFTLQQERDIRGELDWAKKHGKRFGSVQEMVRDIMKDE